MTRRALAPVVVAWECDPGVPPGIATVARRLGARGCYLRHGVVCVRLGDERVAYLNLAGEQVGRDASGGRVAILEDVPWGRAGVGEMVGSAA